MQYADATFYNVMFSDEKLFVLKHTGNIIWKERGEEISPREIRDYKTSVMVWGCVWYDGRTEIVFTNGNINSQGYTNILAKHIVPLIPPDGSYIFQHDNAPIHSSIHTSKFLFDFGVPTIEHWPPYSPDFNPIERVWAWMTQFVKRRYPTNRRTLKDAIRLAWQEIPQSVSLIQGYINGLPRRLDKVYRHGGTNKC
jgi:hypothetical protein